jgi:PPOX class probable F420-dependent enzyme
LLTAEHVRFLQTARVGHLATADGRGRPSVVPVVFVLDGGKVYTPIDGKPKGDAGALRRIRNIRENPAVAFLVDRYDEDWTRLAFVHIRGTAAILGADPAESDPADHDEFPKAETLPRQKHPQYLSVPLGGPEGLMIRINPTSCTAWGPL